MERLYGLIVDRPKLILGLILFLTGVFGWSARHIQLDSSVESLLPGDNTDSQYYAEIRQLFGSDEIGVVGIIADTIYTPQTLEKIVRLSEQIKAIEGVDDVISLANAVDPIANVTDPPLLMPRIPRTPAEMTALRDTLADRPIYLKNLVAPDGRAAAINVVFADMNDDEFLRLGIDDKVVALLEQESGPERVYYTGLPHLKVYSTRGMQQDLARFVPLTLVFIVVVLYFSFRSARGVVLPVLTVVVSLTWTLGIIVLSGNRLSLGSMALPPLLLVLGTAYSLHVVAEYYELAGPDRSPREVVFEALRLTGPPICLTTLTTVLGFLSLSVNSIVSIQHMGLFSAVGISLACALSLLLVPAGLVLLPLPQGPRAQPSLARVSTALRRLCYFDIRQRRLILILSGLTAVAAVYLTASIRVDSNFQSFFRAEDPIRLATDAINEHLVGSMAFYVAIDGDEPNSINRWETLRRIKDLQLYIDAQPGVDKTVSFVDYCELLDRGAQSGAGGDLIVSPQGEIIQAPAADAQTTFWDNPEQLRGVLQLVTLSPGSFERVVNIDFSRTNILVRTTLSQSSDIMALVERVETFAAQTFPPQLRVRATGNLVLLTKTTGDIVSGQVQSLALAATVIFVIMAGMFLSVRVGLIAMIPNLFPILVFFGLMGLSGAVLNLGTSIVASIALGIAVDNTIHFMTRLSTEVHNTSDQRRALLATLSTIGKPAVLATLILLLGFAVLGFSRFVPIREFGILSAITMAAALASDLVLLPALIATTKIITVWELLHLRLGRDPHKTIPLFAGLRPFQAKLVSLMGEVKTFPRGQPIIRRGEMGNAMFVLVSGTTDVYVHTNGDRKHVRVHGRGDVFGEMGLIRNHERTADVVAAEDVEALVVDERFLSHMQRRYPRTGAKIFLNIARILSDRLQASGPRSGS